MKVKFNISPKLLLICLLPGSSFGSDTPFKGDESNLSFYGITNKINLMRLSQASNNTILMFGDSITQGLNPNDMHFKFVNLGIGGDTVHGITKRIKETNLGFYDAVFFSSGANNFLLGEHGAQLGDEIASTIHYAAPKAKHLFVAETFVPNRIKNPQIAKDFADANVRVYSACQQYKNCTVLSLPPGMIGKDGLALDMAIADGIHLNGKAYSLWKIELNKKMADFPVNYYYRARY